VEREIIALVIQPKERRQDSGFNGKFYGRDGYNEFSSLNTKARSLEQQRHNLQLDISILRKVKAEIL
jgi:hypothetical protein